MAEFTTFCGVSESELKVLNETLQAQQQLLQKLYVELDQERESSATAASEALSMILRLQGEKAAVKMEASQYRRLAEEKICHAEESLEIFEDLIYQKEMEIASLEFQVQAYKCKLLSLGCNEMVASESRFPETLVLQGETFVGVGNVRRHGALNLTPIKDSHQKNNAAEREKSPPVVLDLVVKKLDKDFSTESLDSEKKLLGHSSGGNFRSYWHQIKALDEQVKEISHCNNSARDKSTSLNSGSRSCSSPSLQTMSSSQDSTALDLMTLLDEVKSSDDQDKSDPVGTFSPSKIQDIFEVPKHKDDHDVQTKVASEMSEDKLKSIDLVPKKTGKLCLMDERDNIKKILHESDLYKPRNEVSLECHRALVHPTTGVSETQAKFQQLCQRVERLEGQRSSTSQEITFHGEEERKLLREIHEQINTIRAEISGLKEKETPKPDEEPVYCLKQVMLHFWSR